MGAPSVAAALQVAFRPSTRQTHTDELELITGSSSIIVALAAVLPASKLQLPLTADFGCVPVRQGCVQQLPIKNVGDAGLQFTWTLQEPFGIVPASGQLAPGQTLVCEVRSVGLSEVGSLSRLHRHKVNRSAHHFVCYVTAPLCCALAAGALSAAGGSCLQGGSCMQPG